MFYWGNRAANPQNPNLNPAFCFTTQGLLENGDARCGGWSLFFIDILKTQGIYNASVGEINCFSGLDATNSILLPLAESNILRQDALNIQRVPLNTQFPSFFFVKRWQISPNTFAKELSLRTRFDTRHTESIDIDLIGSPAQGINDNPQPFFFDHAVVVYNNKIYDPSYGTMVCSSLQEWQNLSIDGFGSEAALEIVNRAPIWYLWFRSRANNAQLELRIRQ